MPRPPDGTVGSQTVVGEPAGPRSPATTFTFWNVENRSDEQPDLAEDLAALAIETRCARPGLSPQFRLGLLRVVTTIGGKDIISANGGLSCAWSDHLPLAFEPRA